MNSINNISKGSYESYGWTKKTIRKKDFSFSIKNKIKNLKISKDVIDEFRKDYLDSGCGVGLIDLSEATGDTTIQESLFLKKSMVAILLSWAYL